MLFLGLFIFKNISFKCLKMREKKIEDDTFVVIPAYNEATNISEVLFETLKYAKNVVVVDDGSIDNTSKAVSKYNVYLLKHIVNLGKGASMKTGCEFAISKGAKKIILMDSDGQHDPKDIFVFSRALLRYDVCLGYRLREGQMPLIYRFGNQFLDGFSRFILGKKIIDTQCGYRSFRAEAYKKIEWNSSDYTVETEMLSNITKNKLRYTQVKIKTIYKDNYKGTGVFDGFKIVFNMLRFKFYGIFGIVFK